MGGLVPLHGRGVGRVDGPGRRAGPPRRSRPWAGRGPAQRQAVPSAATGPPAGSRRWPGCTSVQAQVGLGVPVEPAPPAQQPLDGRLQQVLARPPCCRRAARRCAADDRRARRGSARGTELWSDAAAVRVSRWVCSYSQTKHEEPAAERSTRRGDRACPMVQVAGVRGRGHPAAAGGQKKRQGDRARLPLSTYSASGGLRQDPGRAAESSAEARTCGNGSREVRVLLSTYGSRGDVEPMVGLAVQLRALGAEVRVCAPPDEDSRSCWPGGVPLVPVGRPVRAMVTGATPPSAADLPRRAAALVAAQFDKVAAAAEGCDALVATGVMPAAASARSVTEKLGIRYVYASLRPLALPSPHHPPLPHAGPAVPAGGDRQPGAVGPGRPEHQRAVRRGAQHPSGGDRPATGGQRPRLRHHRPAVAGGGPDPGPVAGAGGPRRRADRRVDPARRPPTPGRAGGVPGRRHATGVRGLRQHAAPRRTSPRWPSRRSARRAAAHSSPTAGPTWP